MLTSKYSNSTSEQKKNLGLGLATLALSITSASTAQAAIIGGVTVSGPNTYYLQPSNQPLQGMIDGTGWTGDYYTGSFNFDLHGRYSLAGFSLRNQTFNGVQTARVRTSLDGINFIDLPGAPSAYNRDSPTVATFTPIDAAYVSLQILSIHGASFGIASIQQIQFNSAAAVPEPFTILGTLTAVGGGAALKRRLKGIQSKAD